MTSKPAALTEEQAKNRRQMFRAGIAQVDAEEAMFLWSFESEPRLGENAILRIARQRGLRLSAIIAYCRPFKGSNEGSKPPAAPLLRIEDVAALDEDALALHTQLLNLRDRWIGHSDNNWVRIRDRSPQGTSGREYLFTTSHHWREVMELDHRKVHDLILQVSNGVQKLIGDRIERLRAEGVDLQTEPMKPEEINGRSEGAQARSGGMGQFAV